VSNPDKDHKGPETEEIVAEKVMTVRDVAALLGVSYEDHYFRAVHEVTRDAAPWALVRFQALKR
jgi:hypothetical protein